MLKSLQHNVIVILKRHDYCALFVLKAKEVHKTSQTAINEHSVDVMMPMQTHAHKLNLDIQRNLSDMPHSAEGIQDFDLQRLLNTLEEIDPFKGLHSTYLQEKYLKEKPDLVVSVAVQIHLHVISHAYYNCVCL